MIPRNYKQSMNFQKNFRNLYYITRYRKNAKGFRGRKHCTATYKPLPPLKRSPSPKRRMRGWGRQGQQNTGRLAPPGGICNCGFSRFTRGVQRGLPPPFCPLRGHFPRWGNLPSDFSPRKAKNNSNPFFPGACTSEKTLLSLQVCERPPQASARSRLHPPRFVEMP